MLNQVGMTATLKSIPWFHDLSHENIQHLLKAAEIRSYEKDDVIFVEGEQNHLLYVILEGRIQIESFIPGHGLLPIYIAEPLDVIGWSSLTPVVRQNPSCSRVIENSRLIAFRAEKLLQMCEINHELGFVIMRRVANIVASCMLIHRIKLLGLMSDNNT
ncbi:MAG: Crp/Fnr family transcriptional regulator [Chloroflexota bacterium]|nr:Crp/Fnr family transcriptional regulator [Chloroflexota bacterium]